MFLLGFSCCCNNQRIQQWLLQRFQMKLCFLKSIEHFDFQTTEERFRDTVIVTVSFSGHRLNYAIFEKCFALSCMLDQWLFSYFLTTVLTTAKNRNWPKNAVKSAFCQRIFLSDSEENMRR